MSRHLNSFALLLALTSCTKDTSLPSVSPDASITTSDSGLGTERDGGTDGAIERCTCDAPPPSTCVDARTLRTFAEPGTCTGGECNYAASDMPCLFGCADGRCNVERPALAGYLKAGNPGENDHFGRPVSLSHDLLAIGAVGEDSAAIGDPTDNSASRSGAVYVFRRIESGGWMQEAYLKATHGEANDQFGRAVSLFGDVLAVGADAEDSAATGIDGDPPDDSARDSGAVYVFRRSATGTWAEEAYLKPSNTGAGDHFGWSVSLSGTLLAVGAPFESSSATGVNGDSMNDDAIDSGAVYVFRYGESETWTEEAYLKASNTGAGDRFGAAVSLSGELLTVGAEEEDSNARGVNGDQADDSATESGAVYVFRRGTGGTWAQEVYLKASDAEAEDAFGASLSLEGDSLAVGAMNETVYVYRRSSDGSWAEQAALHASTPDDYDYFGISVSLFGDVLAVGAEGEDSSATGPHGDEESQRASDSGAVYLFRRNESGAWIQELYLKAPNTDADDRFGSSVCLWGDSLAVGSHGESSSATGVNGDESDDSLGSSGAVYVYR